jgi:DNA polymerase-1
LTFASAIASDSPTDGHQQFYSTLENTAHSYQIVQGDLGTSCCCNLLKQQSVCFDTETIDLMHFMLNL